MNHNFFECESVVRLVYCDFYEQELIFFLQIFFQDDPLQQGYQRVISTDRHLAGGRAPTTSGLAAAGPAAPTNTSPVSPKNLQTIVLNTNADNLINLDHPAPSFKTDKVTRALFSDELPTPPTIKKPIASQLKETRVSFEDNFDDEAQDTIAEDFAAQRAHFQKYKTQSSARLLLNVSIFDFFKDF